MQSAPNKDLFLIFKNFFSFLQIIIIRFNLINSSTIKARSKNFYRFCARAKALNLTTELFT